MDSLKDMTRALRRHHVARVKTNRKNYWGLGRAGETNEFRLRQLGKLAATTHPCSRHCCGNPRKWFLEETIQERRAKQDDNTGVDI